MVCLGNICCFLLVQGILECKVVAQGLDWEIDFVGIGFWYIGEQLDFCLVYMVGQYGFDIFVQCVWQFDWQDLKDFDFILVMDQLNYWDIFCLV